MNAFREAMLIASKSFSCYLCIFACLAATKASAESSSVRQIGFAPKSQSSCDTSLAFKQSPTLDLPNQSINGTYVLKLDDADLKSDNIELYRSFNRGPFELIQTLPKFSAISESVSLSGEYGYRAKYVCGSGRSKTVVSESETAYIQVILNTDSGILVSAFQ